MFITLIKMEYTHPEMETQAGLKGMVILEAGLKQTMKEDILFIL